MQQQKLDEQQRSDPETSLHKQKMHNNVPDRAGFLKDPSTVLYCTLGSAAVAAKKNSSLQEIPGF
jgi:hypothetical protein